MRDADVVVEALPGPFALPMGRLAAHCGVTSSAACTSATRRSRTHEESDDRAGDRRDRSRAEAKEIVILPEFGLDPGLDLILGARALAELDEVDEFHAYGAGIPGANARATTHSTTGSRGRRSA